MDLVIKLLGEMRKGCAKVMFDRVVIRVGDRYIVGDAPSIHSKGVTAEEAAKTLKSQ